MSSHVHILWDDTKRNLANQMRKKEMDGSGMLKKKKVPEKTNKTIISGVISSSGDLQNPRIQTQAGAEGRLD